MGLVKKVRKLLVIDIVEAGDFCYKPLNLGECVQISTGAPTP